MDHHQELYELNQQNEEAEYHQWELEQQEKAELEAEEKRNPWYKAFHETFTPDVWKEAEKNLERNKK